MSGESEHFVRRWSRLKRKSAGTGSGRPAAESENTAAPGTSETPAASDPRVETNAVAAVQQDVDLSSLPPIESITAGTDIRAFLQSGVPAELTKAALRRVWSTDPAIRDFVGIAENQWDFTDPNAIPGFGAIDPTTSLQDLVNQAFGKVPTAAREDDVAGAAPPSESADRERPPSDPVACAPAKAADDNGETADQIAPANDFALVAPQQTSASAEQLLRPIGDPTEGPFRGRGAHPIDFPYATWPSCARCGHP
jgi:hypothetical protein